MKNKQLNTAVRNCSNNKTKSSNQNLQTNQNQEESSYFVFRLKKLETNVAYWLELQQTKSQK